MEPIRIEGDVVVGKRIGHAIGFPTANIQPLPGQQLPESGVYAGDIELEGAPGVHRCVVNHGYQPTIPSGRRTIEAHILDFEQDVYERRVVLTLLKRLRDERKFDSREALLEQIGRDIESARGL